MDRSGDISDEEVIAWLAEEGIVEVGEDFPAEGDLFAAGMDSMAVMQLVVAAEERFGSVLGPEDLTRGNLATPRSLAELMRRRR